MNDWKARHGEVIASFVIYLNRKSDNFVLKGGTVLYDFIISNFYKARFEINAARLIIYSFIT